MPPDLSEELRGAVVRLDPLNAVSLLELRTFLPNTMLRDGDVMSMAHALEVRVPFLDQRVVELVASVPGRQKAAAGLPKPLLLRAMCQQIPRGVYERPKQGFTFPWERWLRGALRPLLDGRAFATERPQQPLFTRIDREQCTVVGQHINLPAVIEEIADRNLRHAAPVAARRHLPK